MGSKAYLEGRLLSEAALRFAFPTSIQSYKTLMASRPNETHSSQSTRTLIDALEHIHARAQSNQNHHDKLKASIERLYRDVLSRVRSGALVPYGYKLPRSLSDHPIEVPMDMFLDGIIHWERSELTYRNFEFTGVRLIGKVSKVKDAQSIGEQIPKKEHLKGISLKEEAKAEKSIEPSFADLDPDLHIDDKRAAEYLGVSHRTLQGYRLKGGGPEFVKISHKVVRYKISDLIAWAKSRKRKNTSKGSVV
jgi:hypothetical protein